MHPINSHNFGLHGITATLVGGPGYIVKQVGTDTFMISDGTFIAGSTTIFDPKHITKLKLAKTLAQLTDPKYFTIIVNANENVSHIYSRKVRTIQGHTYDWVLPKLGVITTKNAPLFSMRHETKPAKSDDKETVKENDDSEVVLSKPIVSPTHTPASVSGVTPTSYTSTTSDVKPVHSTGPTSFTNVSSKPIVSPTHTIAPTIPTPSDVKPTNAGTSTASTDHETLHIKGEVEGDIKLKPNS